MEEALVLVMPLLSEMDLLMGLGMTSRKWRRYVREELYRRRRLWRGRKIVWHRKSKPSELVQVLNCRDNMLFAVHVPLCPWVAGRGQERRLLETLAESDSVQCLTIDKVLPKDAEKPDVYMLERGLASLSAKNQLKVLRLHSIGHHPIRLPKLPSSLEVLELTKFVLTAHIVDTIVDSPMPNLVALHLLDFRGDVRWSTRENMERLSDGCFPALRELRIRCTSWDIAVCGIFSAPYFSQLTALELCPISQADLFHIQKLRDRVEDLTFCTLAPPLDDFLGVMSGGLALKKLRIIGQFTREKLSLPELEELEVETSGAWVTRSIRMSSLPSLRVLKLCGLNLHRRSALELAKADLPRLQSLHLSRSFRSYSDLQPLLSIPPLFSCTGISIGLKELNVERTPLAARGLRDICRRFPNLERLCMNSCSLDSYVFVEISKLQRLKTLSLRRNSPPRIIISSPPEEWVESEVFEDQQNADVESAAMLLAEDDLTGTRRREIWTKTARPMPLLESLDMSYCRVDFMAIVGIGQLCPNLKHLYIEGGAYPGLDGLAQLSETLTVLHIGSHRAISAKPLKKFGRLRVLRVFSAMVDYEYLENHPSLKLIAHIGNPLQGWKEKAQKMQESFAVSGVRLTYEDDDDQPIELYPTFPDSGEIVEDGRARIDRRPIREFGDPPNE